MATYYLINKTKVGTRVYYPGDLLDDSVDDTAGVAAAGGRLYASGNATVAAAAAQANGLRLRGQHEQAAGIMLAAASKADVLGVDTATAASTTATNASGTASVTNANATATNQASGVEHMVLIPPTALPAAGVTVHAQDAGGGALNLTTGFTVPLPARTLVITRSAAGPASVDYEVTWNLPGGGTYAETVAVASGASGESAIAGLGIASITTSVDPVSTTDFDTGDGFSLGMVFSGTPVLSVDGVRESPAGYDDASGTIVPTTAPDGAKAFTVLVTAQLHTHTQDAHTHTATDAGHTHTQAAHTHAITLS